MNDRLITIFGGAGFIGRHLVRKLATSGWRIRVISRSPGLAGHLQPLGDVGQIVVQSESGTDEAALGRLLEGSQAVVNLVGILYETGKQRFDEVHGERPGRIARAAANAGVGRLVHVSAIGADDQSSSAYARSKAKGEAAVRQAFDSAVIIRPSIVIGPEDDFFNRFAAMARVLPVLPLIGGGKTRFQPVYVGDVADAIVATLERADAKGRTYEIGGAKTYSFEELLRYMLDVIGRKRFLVDLPFGMAALQARFLEWLPVPPLTRDQLELLKSDNVVGEGALTLDDLGIAPTPIETVAPSYLARHRATPGKIEAIS
ncbi:MAG: complex I NDUFA9 subunit family protein [Alphaproteobacteria bacterium]|nr:complex I NDUFA9 subunit family protein [Alphaproteobacteria bacterium]